RVGAFFATVGTNAGNTDTCEYIVKTDVSDEPLFEMVVEAGDSAKVAVAIPEDATKLILITDKMDDSETGDYSTWYNL
ncbi:MAG: hypothetical protein II214_04590, partial [Alistipes sp.]|nr:hypothetical protein [Alistipes sp.]